MSEINVKPGKTCERLFRVEEVHAAKHIGSGNVSALSTPSMIAFMERTAMECVEGDLPSGYTTVGVEVCVQHLNPAPVGSDLRVVARVVKVEGRRIHFEVEALLHDTVIGRGTHVRHVVNREKFLSKLLELASKFSQAQP